MTEREISAILPGWETIKVIGRGGNGTVYEIERQIGGTVERAALKVISIPQKDGDIEELRSNGYDEESITRRFESYLQDIIREYEMMVDLKGNANIVHCDDIKYIQHDDGIGWDILIRMELLCALPKALGKEVSEEKAEKIGKDICRALSACEKKSILHRDIKPQNIFVAPDGTYKLGDFGIAKVVEQTTSGTKTGTYQYMAPEVYNNEPYGPKADIYSLGLVLYWLLNNRRLPFLPLEMVPSTREEEEARARRMRGERIPAPMYGSERLKKIILKACAYDPENRYQNAEEMLAALEGRTYIRPAGDEPKDEGSYSGEDDEEDNWLTRGRVDDPSSQEHKPDPEPGPGHSPSGQKPKTKPKRWIIFGSVVVLLLICYPTLHIWKAPTCTEPALCKICGKARGSALGHTWMEATCTEPRICTVCNISEGSPRGHSFVNDSAVAPTCIKSGLTEGQHCSVCGKILTAQVTIDALGHDWSEATYTSPATCKRCRETKGSPLSSPKPSQSASYSVIIPDNPASPYGIALRDNLKYGKYYSDENKVNIVSKTFYNRKTDDGKRASWYFSTHRDDIYSGYRVELYYADGILFFANLTRNSKNQVTLHYWGDQMVACKDLRGSNKELSYAGSAVYDSVMSEFGDLYSVSLKYAP